MKVVLDMNVDAYDVLDRYAQRNGITVDQVCEKLLSLVSIANEQAALGNTLQVVVLDPEPSSEPVLTLMGL